KTMTPNPAPLATQTTLWLGPWIMATQFNKFLDFYRKTDYHLLTFLTGLAGLVLRAAAPQKAPPFFQ
ncbi:MAG: hypothetical protein JW786_03095, partial [Desulfobacterales bacterium]|nr:hypothetical protein [Desulfobacterales bacterium]